MGHECEMFCSVFFCFFFNLLWLQTKLICSQNTPEQSEQLFVADARLLLSASELDGLVVKYFEYHS